MKGKYIHTNTLLENQSNILWENDGASEKELCPPKIGVPNKRK